MACSVGRVRLTRMRGAPRADVGHRGRRSRRQGEIETRERHRADDGDAVDREGHVHGPVAAGGLRELAGAVERVDDPDALVLEPAEVVGALLREHAVVGEATLELGGEVVVRAPVAGPLEGVAFEPLAPHVEQERARSSGELGGSSVVGGGDRAHRAGKLTDAREWAHRAAEECPWPSRSTDPGSSTRPASRWRGSHDRRSPSSVASGCCTATCRTASGCRTCSPARPRGDAGDRDRRVDGGEPDLLPSHAAGDELRRRRRRHHPEEHPVRHRRAAPLHGLPVHRRTTTITASSSSPTAAR